MYNPTAILQKIRTRFCIPELTKLIVTVVVCFFFLSQDVTVEIFHHLFLSAPARGTTCSMYDGEGTKFYCTKQC